MAPKSEPDRERVDLAAHRAQQATEQTEAARKAVREADPVDLWAAAVSRRDTHRGLDSYLAGAGRGHTRPRGIPPLELAAEWDDELGKLIEGADQAHVDAIGLATDWMDSEPGGTAFARMLASNDEVLIVAHLVGSPARFARAWTAQTEARQTDDRVREYAAAAVELHAKLDAHLDAKTEEIRGLLVLARDAASPGRYEDAMALVGPWRLANRLYGWCLNPAVPFSYPSGDAFPAAVEWIEHEAASACGQQRWSPPTHAVDAPHPDVRVAPMVTVGIH